jgi:23S rRNA (guanine745-N1)-methyltransferase
VTPPLACPVRGCALPLQPHERRYTCARGHSHDIARSGYVNLLQPQDRRSLDAGDSADVVRARAAALAAGVGIAQQQAVIACINQVLTGSMPVVLDLGSGTGDLLRALTATRPVAAIGIDLSVAAAEYAARRAPELSWVVANADRRLPILDHSVDVVVSVHGRRHPPECDRVLVPGGALVVAVPGPTDLVELRAAVQGRAVERDRGDDVIEAHDEWFVLEDRRSVTAVLTLSGDGLRAILRATYRGVRTRMAAEAEALTSMDVTTDSEIFVLRRRL